MPGTDAKKLVVQGKSFWVGLSAGKRLVLMLAALATVGAVVYASLLRDSVDKYETLYTGVPSDEGDAIEAELKKSGIPFRRDQDGAVIKVPASRMSETRVAMASRGYPRKGGVGYEIFDKQSFGTTGFVEQMNYRRALQGELERTIVGLAAIESARVHIALPEKSLFKDDKGQPSASVVVRLFPGRALSPGQVRGIVNLVSFSVPGLITERVSLVDDTGRVLSESNMGAGDLDFQQGIEHALARRVRGILERVVGEGHIEVQVTAEMDFTKITTTEELYDKDKAALRSEQRTEDWSGNGGGPVAAGIAGARGNLPGAPLPSTVVAGGGSGAGTVTETRNYEVSKTVQVAHGGQPKVKRLNVAILVDGVADPKAQPKEGEPAPTIPRSDQELARLAGLAKQAVGFDENRGDKLEIQSSTFAPATALPPAPPTQHDWPPWLRSSKNQLLLKAGGLAIALILGFAALVILIRSVRLRSSAPEVLTSLPRPVRDIEAELSAIPAISEPELPPPQPALPLPPPIPIPPKPREVAAMSAKRDLTRTVRVISSWLTEPMTTGGGR
ncbi:MAG: flagellar M-ring protein FliF [Deltaproteobacteria bacterium]|nr:flagellar M-ring protein FliF [Deltaproteobacteria bacterium]